MRRAAAWGLVVAVAACRAEPHWTVVGAAASHLGTFDDDHDGVVGAAEYEARLWNGPPFATADEDHDGALSAVELLRLARAQPATTFDGAAAPGVTHRAGAGVSAPRGAARDAWEVLVWMDAALQARGAVGLTPDELDAAVVSGGLDTPEGEAALGVLAPGWVAQGWAWPAGVPVPPAAAVVPRPEGAREDASARITDRLLEAFRRSRGPGAAPAPGARDASPPGRSPP